MKRFKVTFTLEGPILTGANAVGGYGVDSPIARNHEDKPYFAGSHVLGKVRQAFFDLEMKVLNEKVKEDTYKDDRRTLFFSDFIACWQGNKQNTRTRIKIGKNGVVEEGALQVMEEPFYSGKKVNFTGYFYCQEVQEHDVKTALHSLIQLGGNRSTGFGRVLKCAIEPADLTLTIPKTGQDFTYRLIIHDPFCFPDTRISHNTFISSDVVSGAALKGAIANMGCDVTKITISHAQPICKTAEALPHPLPLSSYFDENNNLKDYFEHPSITTPLFQPDWKEKQWGIAANEKYLHKPSRHLRVRTAVDNEKLSATDKSLFAYEMVEPQGFEWRGTLHIPAEKLDAFTKTIEHGLIGLGKSHNFAELRLELCDAKKYEFKKGATYKIMLKTPALLRSPEESYEIAFKNLGFTLGTFFMQERYFGGEHVARKKGGEYHPFLLTQAGSVFQVTADKDLDLSPFLALSNVIINFYNLKEPHWKQCVLLPENGFGEIEVLP